MAEAKNIKGEIRRRRWDWTGHVLRKDPIDDRAVGSCRRLRGEGRGSPNNNMATDGRGSANKCRLVLKLLARRAAVQPHNCTCTKAICAS